MYSIDQKIYISLGEVTGKKDKNRMRFKRLGNIMRPIEVVRLCKNQNYGQLALVIQDLNVSH